MRDPLKDIEALAVRYLGEANGREAAGNCRKMARVSLEIVSERIAFDP